MFQMKFYAVALLRSRGVLPARLRLLYLADGQVLDYTPDLDELLRFEKTLMAMWRAIQSAGVTGDFRPQPSRLCDWCAHHSTARSSVALRRPTPGGRRPPTRVTMTRCCTRRSRLRDRLLLSSASCRRRVSGVRVHRRHPQQLGPRNPARLTAVGTDDEGDRGAGRRFRVARRTAGAGHPRRHSRCAGAGSGLGGAPGVPHLDDGGRDARLRGRTAPTGRSPG